MSTGTQVSHSSLPAITCRLKSVVVLPSAVAVGARATLVPSAIIAPPDALGSAKTFAMTLPSKVMVPEAARKSFRL